MAKGESRTAIVAVLATVIVLSAFHDAEFNPLRGRRHDGVQADDAQMTKLTAQIAALTNAAQASTGATAAAERAENAAAERATAAKAAANAAAERATAATAAAAADGAARAVAAKVAALRGKDDAVAAAEAKVLGALAKQMADLQKSMAAISASSATATAAAAKAGVDTKIASVQAGTAAPALAAGATAQEQAELKTALAEVTRLETQVALAHSSNSNHAPAGYETAGILSDTKPWDFRTQSGVFPHGGPEVRVSFGQVGAETWWPTAFAAGTWERHTFQLWHKLIDARTVYIGFGAWVGPTALFAAHRAKYVFVFEPDPFCFSDLWANFVLNPHVTTNKVTLHRQCISNKRELASFLGEGGSGSGMGETVLKRAPQFATLPRWNVQCDRLMPSLSKLKPSPFGMLTPGDKLFLKMDTEGAELIIFPDIFDVLLKAQEQIGSTGQIVIILSMHQSLRGGTPSQVSAFWSAIARFKTCDSVQKYLAGQRTPVANIVKQDFHSMTEFVVHGPVAPVGRRLPGVSPVPGG